MNGRVVALHGFLGRGRDWEAVRRVAHQDVEWICPDLFAPDAPDWRRPPDFSGRAWLAGYSFGARLALRWMQEQPDRWCGALLLSANPGNFQSAPERADRRRADNAWASAFRTEDWDSLMRRWAAQPVLAGGAAPPRPEKDFDRARLAEVLQNFSVADQTTDATGLRSPLLWMAGDADGKFCGLLRDMREEGFPGEFLQVPGAGHRLLVEAPGAVADALDRLTA
jgi:2-succinyl-6-hydroxy-2,4-cyclohexadiene-1-carboxylate synthase